MTVQSVDNLARVLTIRKSFVSNSDGQPLLRLVAHATYELSVRFALASLGELIFSNLFTLEIDGVSKAAFLLGALFVRGWSGVFGTRPSSLVSCQNYLLLEY